jgi:hypothetical protein
MLQRTVTIRVNLRISHYDYIDCAQGEPEGRLSIGLSA